ncbi:MAG TPA: TPM domain-containing protein [Candidatus Limnocylindrales bacterium]
MRSPRRLRVAGFAAMAVWLLLLASAGTSLASPQVGPPYPAPVDGQRVYDFAPIFSSAAIAQAEETIRQIEATSGAQVAVYTQVKPWSDSPELANADALALMNQWGVGRAGFDDGLVILFDMQSNLRHGQVSLYAGSGFKAAFMTNSDRQRVFDADMMPLLKNADFDGALAVALSDIAAAATPQHADELSRARIANAIVGIGVLGLAVLLVGFVLFRWYTKGRDPIYVQDNSILMPAPPDGLTPAMATLLMDDRSSSRTVSAAMVDLAARGLLQFKQDSEFFAKKTNIGVTGKTEIIPTPEAGLFAAIASRASSDGFVPTTSAHGLLPAIGRMKSDLEELAVQKGWFTAKPSRQVGLWITLAVAEGLLSIPLFFWSWNLDASGGFLGGGALIVAAVITAIMAWFMPCRTKLGAMLQAMLAAYKRTLQYTMAQSASMDQVVAARALPWVTTPDAAMAWGVALGLNADIEALLGRTIGASQASGRQVGWYPIWFYGAGFSGGSGGSGGFGGGGGGMFSSSAIPDVGSMMSSLGSIGSTGSGGGGGGFGGGGGGGGGGAGGGF